MRVVYHPAAVEDLVEASQFYDSKLAGLGTDFLDEVDRAVDEVVRESSHAKCNYLSAVGRVGVSGGGRRAGSGQLAVFVRRGPHAPRAWAEHLDLPVEVTNSVGMKFSLIPPGQFLMGSPPAEQWHRDDETLHRVTLTKAFYMGTTEVTQGQWKALMGTDPSFCTGEALPVETVAWKQAVEFCGKLGQNEGVEYRLPTEAQWEYACRVGTSSPFHTGKTISTGQANYDGNYTYAGGPMGVFREVTTDVGSFAPNAWGLHAMHGNVWVEALQS